MDSIELTALQGIELKSTVTSFISEKIRTKMTHNLCSLAACERIRVVKCCELQLSATLKKGIKCPEESLSPT